MTKNGTLDGTVLKLRTPRTEQIGMIVLRLRMEWDGMEWNGTEQNESGTIEKRNKNRTI